MSTLNKDGSLDFEVVNVADARRVLDEVEGRAAVRDAGRRKNPGLLPGLAGAGREPAKATLDPLTQRWLAELPDDIRPVHVSQRYGRIAARLAQAWPEPRRALAYLAELMVDRRGNRAGFPREAMDELLCLHRALSAQVLDASAPALWSHERML